MIATRNLGYRQRMKAAIAAFEDLYLCPGIGPKYSEASAKVGENCGLSAKQTEIAFSAMLYRNQKSLRACRKRSDLGLDRTGRAIALAEEIHRQS